MVIIDVSQSVENEHPQALDFLKRDCVNVNSFFGKRMGRETISVKKLFAFVVIRQLPVVDGVNFAAGAEDVLSPTRALTNVLPSR